MISVHMATSVRIEDRDPHGGSPETGRFDSGCLKDAVGSILSQTFRDFELIICDDSGSDETASYLNGVTSRDSRVTVFRNERTLENLAVSLGRCFERMSRGCQYVTWMFDHTVLGPNAFHDLISGIEGDTALDFIFGETVRRLPSGNKERIGIAGEEEIRIGFEEGITHIPIAGLLAKRSLFERCGWFDASIIVRPVAGTELLRRMSRAGKFSVVPSVIAETSGAQDAARQGNALSPLLPLTAKYCALRDAERWPLSLQAALYHPVDRIPQGDWSQTELRQISLIMAEYFLSIGDTLKAHEWSERLRSRTRGVPPWLERVQSPVRRTDLRSSAAIMGASTGLVLGYAKLEDQTGELTHLDELLRDSRAQSAKHEEYSRYLDSLLIDARNEREAEREQNRSIRLEAQLASAELLDYRKQYEELNERHIAAQHAAEETRQALESTVTALRIELLATRHRVADSLNNFVRKSPFLHSTLTSAARILGKK